MTFEEAREYASNYSVVTERTTTDDDESDWWYASCPKFPGLLGDGKTSLEAKNDLRDVIAYALIRRVSKSVPFPV